MEQNNREHRSVIFLGGGNMARALVSCWVSGGYDPKKITVIDRNLSKREHFENSLGVLTASAWRPEHAKNDVIVLAIKPQDAELPCRQVGVDLNTVHQSQKTNQPLMVSLMAGITVSTLIRWLGQAYPIVRAMPNMASSVYEGATGLYRHSSVSESQMAWTAELMSRLGAYAWLDHEDLIHSVIPLSGSAPAFYFYFAEIMSKVALEMGLDPTVVAQFSKQTLFGSGVLAHQSEKSFETLRAEVTSKKGTTDAAIQYFQAHGLENIIRGAMQACRNRSVEIAKIMEGEIL